MYVLERTVLFAISKQASIDKSLTLLELFKKTS